MKTAVYYFSGTGNSLSVAKELAKEIGDSTIYPLSKIMSAVKSSEKSISPTGDRIVIVTPVYMGGVPRIVAEFTRKLKMDEEKKVYAIATHGGVAGRVLFQVDGILRENNSHLSGGFLIKMPGNNITLYSAHPKSKQESMLRVAKIRIKEIAQVIREGVNYRLEESHGPVGHILSGPIYKVTIMHLKDRDRFFYVTEKCNGCGMCAGICPVHNIKMVDGRPEWQHNCEQCMACIQWCPVEAIEHGSKTTGRKRYTHPDIQPEELMHSKA
jgi:ferredoxin